MVTEMKPDAIAQGVGYAITQLELAVAFLVSLELVVRCRLPLFEWAKALLLITSISSVSNFRA
jgi:hypothetical protein